MKREDDGVPMKIYFAPLEGITGYIYRNAYHDFFDCGISKYFTPFIAVNQNGLTKHRELEDLKAANNEGLVIVPQLLGNKGGEMAGYLYRLQEMGYEEVNLNLGCPYQTVVSKKKGAGLLADKEYLKRFLEDVFTNPPVAVSIKTRIGMEKAEEFEEILEIYNEYPVSELIVHPRVREDFYQNSPDLLAFAFAASKSIAPVCYNGDIFTAEDYQAFTKEFPGIDRLMIGRGLLTNPGLLSKILEGEGAAPIGKEKLKAFHDRIYRDYREVMSGDKDVLFKMKELWNYMQFLFEDREKYIKKIRGANKAVEYESAVLTLFNSCEIMPEVGFGFERRKAGSVK